MTNGLFHHTPPSPVRIIPEGGASVSGAVGTGGVAGGDEVISLNTEGLTPSQQAVMSQLEEAGMVRELRTYRINRSLNQTRYNYYGWKYLRESFIFGNFRIRSPSLIVSKVFAVKFCTRLWLSASKLWRTFSCFYNNIIMNFYLEFVDIIIGFFSRWQTAMFAVSPKPWCEHLEYHVKPLPPGGIDASKVCETCQSPQEPWVCLTCYHVS